MTHFDTARAEAFAAEMVGHLNGAAVSLMTSLGYRTGLFDALHDQPPLGPFAYALSCTRHMSVSLANGGAGLGAARGKERALDLWRRRGPRTPRAGRTEPPNLGRPRASPAAGGRVISVQPSPGGCGR